MGGIGRWCLYGRRRRRRVPGNGLVSLDTLK